MGIFKECSPEFLESIDTVPFAEVNFDISNIESHHPTIYLGVDLSAELDVEVNEKAWEAYISTPEPEYTAYDEAKKAMEATPAYKAYEEAKKAMWATPEYKDWKEVDEPYG